MDSKTQSLIMSAAVGGLVVGVFQGVAPSISDVTASPADDEVIYRNTKTASWISAGLVSGVALLAKDPTIFILGSAIIVGMSLWMHTANNTDTTRVESGTVTRPAVKKEAAPMAAEPTMSETVTVSSTYGAF